jgi:hypothetical protein
MDDRIMTAMTTPIVCFVVRLAIGLLLLSFIANSQNTVFNYEISLRVLDEVGRFLSLVTDRAMGSFVEYQLMLPGTNISGLYH